MFWRQSDPEGLALYKALEKVRHAARAQYAALPVHQRQPLGPRQRERAVRRQAADAARPRALSRRSDARRRSTRTSPRIRTEGVDLRPVHDRARRTTATGLDRHRRITTSSPPFIKPAAARAAQGRRRCRTIPRSRSSSGCAPTRCSPTTTTRATSRGSICRTRSSTSSSRRTRPTSTTCSA